MLENDVVLVKVIPHHHSRQKKASLGRGKHSVPERRAHLGSHVQGVSFLFHSYLPSCALNHRNHRSGETRGWGEEGKNFPKLPFFDEYLHLILFVHLFSVF